MLPLKTDNAQHIDELGPSLTNGSESGEKQFSKILRRWELRAPGLRGLTSISRALRCAAENAQAARTCSQLACASLGPHKASSRRCEC